MQQPGSIAMTDDDLVAAFPHQLASDVRAVLAVMPEARIAPVSPFSVYVGDEAVAIPYRIYQDELPDDVVRALTGVQQAILHCLYSRHSDGLVRQRHLEQIASSDEPWAVPWCSWPASTSWRSWSPSNTAFPTCPLRGSPSGWHTETSSHAIRGSSRGPSAG
ncbi:hypothetical protein [Streptomyces rubiginosohelvolus]|uniref:hypothetical protein n=1 Tax=Streptomyces rubiginosohelvolus TaxID=67362 RepID=UPI0035DE6F08